MSIVLWAQEAVLLMLGLYWVLFMGPSGRIGYILHILECLGQDMQVLYLGRAPRTKETLPDFLKWRQGNPTSTCIPRVTGSQRTPGFGTSQWSSFLVYYLELESQ